MARQPSGLHFMGPDPLPQLSVASHRQQYFCWASLLQRRLCEMVLKLCNYYKLQWIGVASRHQAAFIFLKITHMGTKCGSSAKTKKTPSTVNASGEADAVPRCSKAQTRWNVCMMRTRLYFFVGRLPLMVRPGQEGRLTWPSWKGSSERQRQGLKSGLEL